LKNIVNVEGNVDLLNLLVDQVFANPIALLCVGILLKEKLSLREVCSIDEAVKEVSKDLEQKIQKVLQNNQHLAGFTSTISGRKLVTIETLIAIVMKDILNKDPYLKHGIDMMASLAPGTPIPHQLITRHLSSSFYKLPSLAKPPSLFDFMSKQKRDAEDVKKNSEEYDPKGKAWSNKNLVKYVRKAEEFFETAYKTVKEIYFLIYGEVPELPEGDDGMGMFASCELIQSSKLEPGGEYLNYLK